MIIILISIIVKLYKINTPLCCFWESTTVSFADIARNILEGTYSINELSYSTMPYHHPPLTALITALFFFIFGVNDFILRVIPIFFMAGSTFFFSQLIKLLYSRKISFYSTIIFLFLAMNMYMGRILVFETLLLFFILSYFYYYLLYLKDSKIRYFIISLILFFFGSFTEYFIIFSLAPIIYFSLRKRNYHFIYFILTWFFFLITWLSFVYKNGALIGLFNASSNRIQTFNIMFDLNSLIIIYNFIIFSFGYFVILLVLAGFVLLIKNGKRINNCFILIWFVSYLLFYFIFINWLLTKHIEVWLYITPIFSFLIGFFLSKLKNYVKLILLSIFLILSFNFTFHLYSTCDKITLHEYDGPICNKYSDLMNPIVTYLKKNTHEDDKLLFYFKGPVPYYTNRRYYNLFDQINKDILIEKINTKEYAFFTTILLEKDMMDYLTNSYKYVTFGPYYIFRLKIISE